jgi:hypothetical protein
MILKLFLIFEDRLMELFLSKFPPFVKISTLLCKYLNLS